MLRIFSKNKLHKGLLWFAECFCVTQAKDIGDLRLQFAQYDPVLQVSLRDGTILDHYSHTRAERRGNAGGAALIKNIWVDAKVLETVAQILVNDIVLFRENQILPRQRLQRQTLHLRQRMPLGEQRAQAAVPGRNKPLRKRLPVCAGDRNEFEPTGSQLGD